MLFEWLSLHEPYSPHPKVRDCRTHTRVPKIHDRLAHHGTDLAPLHWLYISCTKLFLLLTTKGYQKLHAFVPGLGPGGEERGLEGTEFPGLILEPCPAWPCVQLLSLLHPGSLGESADVSSNASRLRAQAAQLAWEGAAVLGWGAPAGPLGTAEEDWCQKCQSGHTRHVAPTRGQRGSEFSWTSWPSQEKAWSAVQEIEPYARCPWATLLSWPQGGTQRVQVPGSP